jgi:hypothetical protein
VPTHVTRVVASACVRVRELLKPAAGGNEAEDSSQSPVAACFVTRLASSGAGIGHSMAREEGSPEEELVGAPYPIGRARSEFMNPVS